MAATAVQLARVRALSAEPTTATFSDLAVTTFIEAHPLPDLTGQYPYVWDYSTNPPTQIVNPLWVEDYDLYAAAVDIWEEKLAVLAQDYNFSADGASLDRQSRFGNYRKMAAYCKSKIKVVGVATGPWNPISYTGVVNQS